MPNHAMPNHAMPTRAMSAQDEVGSEAPDAMQGSEASEIESAGSDASTREGSIDVRSGANGPRATARAALEELSAEGPAGLSEDWLGEQLALLTRAERSLAERDPAGALRTLDEYQARFPKGLLDLQIAALRERAQRIWLSSEASRMPRSD
jgi:hypothetical protein